MTKKIKKVIPKQQTVAPAEHPTALLERPIWQVFGLIVLGSTVLAAQEIMRFSTRYGFFSHQNLIGGALPLISLSSIGLGLLRNYYITKNHMPVPSL